MNTSLTPETSLFLQPFCWKCSKGNIGKGNLKQGFESKEINTSGNTDKMESEEKDKHFQTQMILSITKFLLMFSQLKSWNQIDSADVDFSAM